MPSKVFTYPDGSKFEIHKDGSFTMTGKGGDPSFSFDKKGNCTIKVKGFPPKVVKGEEKKKGKKFQFEIDGSKWTIVHHEKDIEIEIKKNAYPPKKAEVRVDKTTGEKTEIDDDVTKKMTPEKTETIPDNPYYDPAVESNSGGGIKKSKKKRGKSGRR